mgnify:CR=1 FL=1
MMIGSEDSRSPLGRASILAQPMTLQPLHSIVQRCSVTPAVLPGWRADSASCSRLRGTFSLQCSGALLANLCPVHSSHTGQCTGCNSLELRARHCRAKVPRNFRTALLTFVEFVDFLTLRPD